MSHGLRSITGTCGYVPNGSGRDWFFIGDLGFRKGKDEYNRSASAIKRPTSQPQPAPLEMRQQRSLHGAGKSRVELKKKWEKAQDGMAKRNVLPKCRSLPQYYESSYSHHGRIPGWSFPPPETAISLLGTLPPPPKEGVYGLGLNMDNFKSTYADIGNIPGFKHASYGTPSKHHTMSLPVFPEVQDYPKWRPGVGPPINPDPANEAKNFTSTYMDHGKGFKPQTKGYPSKHHHHSVVGESRSDADKSHGAVQAWDVLEYRPGKGDPGHRSWM